MGMLAQSVQLQSGVSKAFMHLAIFSESYKRAKEVTDKYRHAWSRRRLWMDRLKGISFEQSYANQFAEHGEDYHECCREAMNSALKVLFGEEAEMSSENYRKIHAYAAGDALDREEFAQWVFDQGPSLIGFRDLDELFF